MFRALGLSSIFVSGAGGKFDLLFRMLGLSLFVLPGARISFDLFLSDAGISLMLRFGCWGQVHLLFRVLGLGSFFLFRALGLSLFSVSGLEFVTSGAGIQFHYSVSCPGLKSDFPKMSPPFFKNPQVFSELLALTRNFLVRPSS